MSRRPVRRQLTTQAHLGVITGPPNLFLRSHALGSTIAVRLDAPADLPMRQTLDPPQQFNSMFPHQAKIDGVSFAFAKLSQITRLEKHRSSSNIIQ